MLKAPGFWSRRPGLAARLLWPIGQLYYLGSRLREAFSQPKTISVPIICIGNPTLGGAGKTPTTIAVAEVLTRLGAQPHFLSRGYGGHLEGPLTVDSASHRAYDVGDEPLLLATRAPTHICRNRAAGAAFAARSGAQIIVMDDGFQNPTLSKDMSLLVIDAGVGVGNGFIFPAGPLRGPLRQQITRADALVLIGQGDAGQAVAQVARDAGIPVLTAALEPAQTTKHIVNKRVFAFSGIGRPGKFLQTLSAMGVTIAGHSDFADHHAYHAADLAEIEALAEDCGADAIVTTEKDFVRLDEGNDPDSRFRSKLDTVPVKLVFDDPKALEALVMSVIQTR